MFKMVIALQAERYNTTKDLTERLGISRRTLYRDLRELQEAGVPCHYNKETGAYIVDPQFFLPAPNLSTKEALGLFLLVYFGS